MLLMVSEELQMKNALNGFRGVTDGGCPFRFQRSYRWRVPFQVSEELQMDNALNGFRGVTDGGCPFRF
jgi:hypothetical protein